MLVEMKEVQRRMESWKKHEEMTQNYLIIKSIYYNQYWAVLTN